MMDITRKQNIIEDAINLIQAKSPHSTDGKWLECLTVEVAPRPIQKS